MKSKYVISHISEVEDTSPEELKQNIKLFEKHIKSQVKKYNDTSGLEDLKLNSDDYYILYNLYINTKSSPYKVTILLYFIYCYYKLDGIEFSRKKFPFKDFFNFMRDNDQLHQIVLNLVTK